ERRSCRGSRSRDVWQVPVQLVDCCAAKAGSEKTGAQFCSTGGKSYLSAVETEVKVVFNLEPSPCTTAIIATEMPAAMRPYSMAVAPDSSLTKRISVFMFNSFLLPSIAKVSELT